jgi:serine/threonine-protein kinase RsbW
VISVPARLECRDQVGTQLVEACRRQVPGEPGEILGHQIVSVFNEAFNNVVLHAYADTAEGMLEISLDIEPPRLELTITDNGRSFDPRDVPLPDLDSLPEGGLGLYIMRAIMNEVDYQPGTPNVLRLIKYLDEEAHV